MAHHLGLPVDGASTALRRVVSTGFCVYDDATEWIWVPEITRFQIDEELRLSTDPQKKHDSRIAWVVRELLAIKNVCFAKEFVDKYRASYHLEVADQWPALALAIGRPVDAKSRSRSRISRKERE